MKVPELYVHEILSIMRFVDQYAEKVLGEVKRIQRRAEFRRRFWPFGGHRFRMESMLRLAMLNHELGCCRELKNKLLSSTGTDEDEQPITLADVIQKMQGRKNA